MRRIEIVDGFYKPDAADLKQIVGGFAFLSEFTDGGQNEPQISRNELFARRPVAFFEFFHQYIGFLIGKRLKIRRIHGGYFDFII